MPIITANYPNMKKLNVLVDFHHAGLLHSLIMLFEDRLGGAVYRPIGRDWFDRGFWKIYDHPATVAQYLDIGGATPDGTPRLNELVEQPAPDIYKCQDIDSGYFNKAITLHGFFTMDFDVVIASIPAHIEPFKKLCELHPNRPKLIFQIGNAWTTGAGLAPNIMASAIIHNIPENINFISYHQEFNLSTFYPHFPHAEYAGLNKDAHCKCLFHSPGKNIYSFVNVFNGAPHYSDDWRLFELIEAIMPGWNFKSYGGQCRDGAKHGDKEVAAAMREAMFIWHTKAGGDGYGHVIHNAPAVARPLIVKKEYYRGKMAEPLLVDGVSCIAIDGLTPNEIQNKIEHFSNPAEYYKLCRGAYDTFKNVVNFDAEQKEIEKFLEKLV